MLHPSPNVYVLEEIINPLLLHKAAHEVKVRLPILHAMIYLPVTRGQSRTHIIEPMVLENFLNDSRNRHLVRRVGHCRVENPAISGARQKPEPGNDRGFIIIVSLRSRFLNKRSDVPAKKSVFVLPA